MEKNVQIEMREYLGIMRNLGKNSRHNPTINENEYKDMTVRDMLKITRKLNEGTDDLANTEQEEPLTNEATPQDQSREEQRMRDFFNDMNVNFEFQKLEVYPELIWFGGTVDGTIQFIFKVTPDEASSGVEFNYLGDFDRNNPDNQEVVEKIESYYDSFYKYWRNNVLNNN
jgi:hypothetical protein